MPPGKTSGSGLNEGLARFQQEQRELKVQESLPALPEGEREALLLPAGYPAGRRARVIAETIRTQITALKASKPRMGPDGKPIRGLPDWTTRLRAAEALQALFGVVGSRMANASGKSDVKISVGIADFSQPQPVDGTVVEMERKA